MTPGQTNHLALVGETTENVGAEQAPSLVELLDASIHDALLRRLRMTEKRVEKLYACPEIAAMLARHANREAY